MTVLDENALRSLIRDEVRAVVREELAKLELGRPVAQEFLSPETAATLTETSASTIRSWLREGRLRTYHAGRLVRVRRDELEALLSSAGSSAGNDTAPTAATIIARGRR